MGLFGRTRLGPGGPASRLHIGCGQEAMPGWINIDNRRHPGVDRVLDVRRGLPFVRVSAIYAEHFLEHLTLDEGLQFLKDCRHALAPEGTLRLSTPNLDWVLQSHYHGPHVPEDQARRECAHLNRAFQGWGHRFLYNRAMLEAAVRSAGFARAASCRYGESDVAELRGLERHETWADKPDLPHVLIVEASGAARPEPIPVELLRIVREAPA